MPQKKQKRNVTLGDISARAGVSKTAVSKVLNGRPMRISAEKREEILALAKSLNYHPNIIARSLKGDTTRTIGIVIPDLTTLFYPELVRRIETGLAAERYRTIVCNTCDDPACEREQLDNLLARLVDGVVLVPAAGTDNLPFFREIHARGMPFLMLDRYYPDESFHYVATQNRAGATTGTMWLCQEGATHILYLGETHRNHALDERTGGVSDAANANTVPFSERDVFLSAPDRSSVARTCQALLDRACPGAGVFVESHRLMMGLLDACNERALRIPDDLLTVGFDVFEPSLLTAGDLASLGRLTAPPPTLRQDTAAMADQACQYLFQGFADELSRDGTTWQRLLVPELIVEGTAT